MSEALRNIHRETTPISSVNEFFSKGILALRIAQAGHVTISQLGWSRIPAPGTFAEIITNNAQVATGPVILDFTFADELVAGSKYYERKTAKLIHDFTTEFLGKLDVDSGWRYPTHHPTLPFEVTVLSHSYGSVENMFWNSYGATFVYKPDAKPSILR